MKVLYRLSEAGTQVWKFKAEKSSAEDPYQTAGFVASTGLKIWPAWLLTAEGEEEEEVHKEEHTQKLNMLKTVQTNYLNAGHCSKTKCAVLEFQRMLNDLHPCVWACKKKSHSLSEQADCALPPPPLYHYLTITWWKNSYKLQQ